MVIAPVDIDPIINRHVLLIVIQPVLNILRHIFDIAELLMHTGRLNPEIAPIVGNFLFTGLLFIGLLFIGLFLLIVLRLDLFFRFVDASAVLVDIVFGSLRKTMGVDVDRW